MENTSLFNFGKILAQGHVKYGGGERRGTTTSVGMESNMIVY